MAVDEPIFEIKSEIAKEEEESTLDFLSTNIINYDSMVTCGKCKKQMTYQDYEYNHFNSHYSLCWIDGVEEEIDLTDTLKVQAILKQYTKKCSNNKLKFKCEMCDEIKLTVSGYANHLKKCKNNSVSCESDILLKESSSSVSDRTSTICNDKSMVTCGRCGEIMSYAEYNNEHKNKHYYLCWLDGEEKPAFDDENRVQYLIKQSLPKYAARLKKVKFICEWCQVVKKSVPGFASHIKQCKIRPDKLGILNESKSENGTTLKSDIEISKERDATMVTCGRCNQEMTFFDYRTNHLPSHYNLCWIDGEDRLDLENYDIVLAKLKQFIPFSAVRKRTVKLTCEVCQSTKKSVAGFASHVIFCNKTDSDIKSLLLRCDECGHKVKPSSLVTHKLKNCKGLIGNKGESGDDSTNDRTDCVENGYSKTRRKRKPPNILSFHPDTKYVTEHFDCMCRLCDFVTLNVNDIVSHILIAHNIDLNNATNAKKIEEYVLTDRFDAQKNLYLNPLFNYYNYFKKSFWKTTCHEDFKPNIQILNNEEAFNYLPSIQQSCKILNSNNEEICVDLFKSTYVNDMLWLFTGGPNWAMSWCPVPEEVKSQYLAISCHPKPDLEHKDLEIYKYPSLVQLWTFNSLVNINYKPTSNTPYMSYGLAHEFGAVWDMAWCPSGAYEPKQKIGLLALSSSCGDCPVFAMPHVNENSEMFNIYKAKPVIARNFECEWIKGGVQCTKVCWQVVSPFKTLICGYSNGMVSVYNINFKSIFLNDDILYPSHTFRASRCCITGLSTNYLNSSILATTSIDGNISIWDIKSTENPVFHKKAYSPSDCTWFQQCYTLVYCSKGVNSLFLKVRTINFSNCDDDFDGYNPELYVLKTVDDRSKVITNYSAVNLNETFNSDDADVSINGSKINEHDSITNSDDESNKLEESGTNSDGEKSNNAAKSGDISKHIDEEDYYGPSFFQKNTHWSVSTSNWMNIIATGDESGGIYEKLFVPNTNQLLKGNSTALQLIVKKILSSDATESTIITNGHRFKETVEQFGIESKFFFSDENLPNQDENKSLLRYPLDNITKVSWNQNFSSFRWLAIGTQSGFTLVSRSQIISDDCIQSFYKSISDPNLKNVEKKTDGK